MRTGNLLYSAAEIFLHLAAGAVALPVASRFTFAQAYPTRPIYRPQRWNLF
jgi:hypothetical protein